MNNNRDVVLWANASATPTLPAPSAQQKRTVLSDQNGVLYVNALGSSAGTPTAIPISTLGLQQAALATALRGMFSPLLWTGATDNTFQRQGSGTAANMNPAVGSGPSNAAALVADLPEWSLPHTPAVGVRATITRAAGGAGVRHVCRSISATLSVALADVAVAGVLVNLRDGATGAGTILWSGRLAVVAAGGLVTVEKEGLNIAGSLNTAMTLEFAAAPGAASFETVTLGGITANAT